MVNRANFPHGAAPIAFDFFACVRSHAVNHQDVLCFHLFVTGANSSKTGKTALPC
ncbi:Uncharacterised protein [Vibrio cholerae]|nr:Uncharacterised protein [Vibrio cholerae]